MGLLDITKAKLLSEIKTAIDNGEDFIVTKSGDKKLIEEQERVPMTLTNNGGLLIKCVVGLVMILWATFFYPEKRGESNK